MLPRVVAFRCLHDGTAARLKPDALHGLALAAGLDEGRADELRDAREAALAEESSRSL